MPEALSTYVFPGTLTISEFTAGAVNIYIVGENVSGTLNTAGTYTYVTTQTGDDHTRFIDIYGNGSLACKIDNVFLVIGLILLSIGIYVNFIK